MFSKFENAFVKNAKLIFVQISKAINYHLINQDISLQYNADHKNMFFRAVKHIFVQISKSICQNCNIRISQNFKSNNLSLHQPQGLSLTIWRWPTKYICQHSQFFKPILTPRIRDSCSYSWVTKKSGLRHYPMANTLSKG